MRIALVAGLGFLLLPLSSWAFDLSGDWQGRVVLSASGDSVACTAFLSVSETTTDLVVGPLQLNCDGIGYIESPHEMDVGAPGLLLLNGKTVGAVREDGADFSFVPENSDGAWSWSLRVSGDQMSYGENGNDSSGSFQMTGRLTRQPAP